MLLENKVAVIYGAGGPIGGAVARAFAREEARVFLAGRTRAKLDKLAGEIRANSGGAIVTTLVSSGLLPAFRVLWWVIALYVSVIALDGPACSTQVINSAIIGVGSAERVCLCKVHWTMARQIIEV